MAQDNDGATQWQCQLTEGSCVNDGAILAIILMPAVPEAFNDYATMYMENIRIQFVCGIVFYVFYVDSLNSVKVTMQTRGRTARGHD